MSQETVAGQHDFNRFTTVGVHASTNDEEGKKVVDGEQTRPNHTVEKLYVVSGLTLVIVVVAAVVMVLKYAQPGEAMPIIVLILAILPPTILSLFAALKAAQTGAKTDEIKTSVDGAAHASVAKIEAMHKELALMRTVAAEKKETAALLAQAVASQPVKPQDP